jgi:cell division protein FtsB
MHRKTKLPRVGRWIVLGLAAALLYSLFLGNSSLVRMYQLHAKAKKKEQAVQRLHRDIDSLMVKDKKLKTDTAYIEKIAREKLGMAKKDEKVYKFIPESGR